MISLLPGRIIKLLEFIGFSGDKVKLITDNNIYNYKLIKCHLNNNIDLKHLTDKRIKGIRKRI